MMWKTLWLYLVTSHNLLQHLRNIHRNQHWLNQVLDRLCVDVSIRCSLPMRRSLWYCSQTFIKKVNVLVYRYIRYVYGRPASATKSESSRWSINVVRDHIVMLHCGTLKQCKFSFCSVVSHVGSSPNDSHYTASVLQEQERGSFFLLTSVMTALCMLSVPVV